LAVEEDTQRLQYSSGGYSQLVSSLQWRARESTPSLKAGGLVIDRGWPWPGVSTVN